MLPITNGRSCRSRSRIDCARVVIAVWLPPSCRNLECGGSPPLWGGRRTVARSETLAQPADDLRQRQRGARAVLRADPEAVVIAGSAANLLVGGRQRSVGGARIAGEDRVVARVVEHQRWNRDVCAIHLDGGIR